MSGGLEVVNTVEAELHPHPWRVETARTYRNAAGDMSGRKLVEVVYCNILDRKGVVVARMMNPTQAEMVAAAANDWAAKWGLE